MANKILFISSVCFGYINLLLSLIFFRSFLDCFIIFVGIITSVLNHYYTDNCLKWIDRLYITTIFLGNINYQKLILFKFGNTFAALSYVLSKILNQPRLHIFSHFLITLSYINYFLDYLG